jgi:hypothetical protein
MMAPLALSKATVPAKYRNLLFRRRFEGIVSLLKQITRRKNVGADKAGVCVREAGDSLQSLLRVLIESPPFNCADTFPSSLCHRDSDQRPCGRIRPDGRQLLSWDYFRVVRDRPGTRNFVVDFPGSPQPMNFTRSGALQFRDSIRVAAAVPKFPLRLK